MPCIAQKYEELRPKTTDGGFRDIDATIDTRQLAYMIKASGIDFQALPDREPDPVPGMSPGAATIFGNNVGVMEAAMRLACKALSKQKLAQPEIKPVRNPNGIKTADVEVPGFGTVKVAVCGGLSNAAELCEEVRAGGSPYHFIEVMACPGGCVNGRGQPLNPKVRDAAVSRGKRIVVNRKVDLSRFDHNC
jgi:ferredoxin hydrogenase large subunit